MIDQKYRLTSRRQSTPRIGVYCPVWGYVFSVVKSSFPDGGCVVVGAVTFLYRLRWVRHLLE